ncbi:ABC transporter substrate-binding protein [Vineibacter terrae]|uniref:ABC transporter substrate-binding protein n=1 Tax=Vineibacter terrae TaxID=2586908 RepID=A0A5C8PFU4_9HYPH|nr:ABC transporter substrate-binding protein [Vineibacter terrae]TXL72652.1 ABC transporter substrate-binding protein [Vineibacter terrae]
MRVFTRTAAAWAIAAGSFLPVAGASGQATYNLAATADFTGPYADVMKDLIGSQRPAIEWWNGEVGQKLGIKLAVKQYDHRYDAAQAASLWPGIKAELNPIIMLGAGGPDVAALQGRLPGDKIPMIMSTAGYGFAWKPDPWIFNPRPTYSHEAAAFFNWFRARRGGSGPLKVAIISSEASPAYIDQQRGIEKYAKDNPDKVEIVESVFTEVQPTDLTTQINRVVRKGAEVISIQTNTAAVVATKRALQALGKNVPILMSSHNGVLDSGRAVGDVKQMEGDFEAYAMAVPTDEKTPARAFFDMLATKHGMKSQWTVTAVQGMGQVLVALRAIEATAKRVGADKITGEAIRETMLSTPIASDQIFGTLPDLKFTKEAPFPVTGLTAGIGTIKDGKYVAAAKDAAVPVLSKW